MPPPPGTASRRWQHQTLERMAPLSLGSRCWGAGRAHRRAFPRPRSSLRDSCWPLETPRGQPLASAPWQMVAPLPFLPRACQLLLGAPSPALRPRPPSAPLTQRAHASLACANTSRAQTCTPSLLVGEHPGTGPPSSRPAPPSPGRETPEGGIGHHRWAWLGPGGAFPSGLGHASAALQRSVGGRQGRGHPRLALACPPSLPRT